MKRNSRFFLCLIVLTVLLASVAIMFTGTPKTTYASPLPNPTAVDFGINAGWNPWGTAFDRSGNVWVAVPQCDPGPVCASDTPPGRIDVYNPHTKSWLPSIPFPSGFGQALFLAFDRQGRVWFPMFMTSSLGMYDPATKTFSQWTVPTLGSGPWDVAIDKQGIVWFTEHYSNKIGSFNPRTQTFHEIATPATNSVPYGIVVDASDNVWFTENSDAVALIGEYTPHSGILKEYKIRNGSTTGVTPHLIAIDQIGNVWWSEGWAGAIGKLTLSQAVPNTNNGVQEFSYPHLCACGVHTSGITTDKRGLVWFDDSIQSTYGYFSISGVGSPRVFNTPSSNSHPHDGIHAAPNNVIWFTEEFANNLGNITFGNTVPTPTLVPSDTPTPVPSDTPTPVPSDTPTPVPSGTPTPVPSDTPTPVPSGTPTPTPGTPAPGTPTPTP